jgi:hypothetical protein
MEEIYVSRVVSVDCTHVAPPCSRVSHSDSTAWGSGSSKTTGKKSARPVWGFLLFVYLVTNCFIASGQTWDKFSIGAGAVFTSPAGRTSNDVSTGSNIGVRGGIPRNTAYRRRSGLLLRSLERFRNCQSWLSCLRESGSKTRHKNINSRQRCRELIVVELPLFRSRQCWLTLFDTACFLSNSRACAIVRSSGTRLSSVWL